MPLYTNGKPPKGHLARLGEDFAAEHYQKQGFSILARNWRAGRYAEVDLIVSRQDGLVVFVEVKTRHTRLGEPIHEATECGFASITLKKQQKIVTSARIYLAHFGLSHRPCRFDAVVITVPKTSLPDSQSAPPLITQVEAAF